MPDKKGELPIPVFYCDKDHSTCPHAAPDPTVGGECEYIGAGCACRSRTACREFMREWVVALTRPEG